MSTLPHTIQWFIRWSDHVLLPGETEPPSWMLKTDDEFSARILADDLQSLGFFTEVFHVRLYTPTAHSIQDV